MPVFDVVPGSLGDNFLRFLQTSGLLQKWARLAEGFCVFCGVCALTLLGLRLVLRLRLRIARSRSPLAATLQGKQTVGFFHPYCAAGGGGERVLWCAVQAVQRDHPGLNCVVYTGDPPAPPRELLSQAEDRFGTKLEPDTVHFAFLRGRRWVEASTWPRFTLLGQSLGSMLLGWEALMVFTPDIFVDTMGYAFTFPLFWLLGRCRVGCYVHYPTISTDMLEQVRSRRAGVCNDAAVARSGALSTAKLAYYKAFAILYGIMGRFAEVVMVNSSWTRGHIDRIWAVPERTRTVFPPCDTRALTALPLERAASSIGGQIVLSLAQFRPEKDHPKQLRAFAQFLRAVPKHSAKGESADRVRLLVAGGVRGSGDQQRLDALRALCSELDLRERPEGAAADAADWDVAFCPNLPLAEVQSLLGQATVGLHTMRDEHFGISVVEFMSAGAIALAHDSAGPAMDIVTPVDGERTGFLATDEESYASRLEEIFSLSAEERLRVAARARKAVVHRFSEEAFRDAFSSGMISSLRGRHPAGHAHVHAD